MKFLLDMNVPRSLAALLMSRGHSCRHVGDMGMSRANDEAILQEARAHQEVVITHDLD
jgi:predicted nuclease of predicted toxin-antitoxin system